jgi:hypothetical protein
MSEPGVVHPASAHAPEIDPSFATWRTAHRSASIVLALLAIAHCALSVMIYDTWSPGAVWFVGTGLGLLFPRARRLARSGRRRRNTSSPTRWR